MHNPESMPEKNHLPAAEGGLKTRKDFLVFSKPKFGEEEINELINTVKSGWVGTGPKVKQFETAFAEYTGARFAIALNSCTAALHLSLEALDLKPGDEVIVPAVTFCATANAVIHAGGTPAFADVDATNLCLTASTIEKALSPKTKAIVAVHFAGKTAPMDEIMALAQKKNIQVIEDCAHAIETRFQGKHAGTFGYTGCFSFYATKNVSCGEGGMLITSDEKLADRIRKLSLHGLSRSAFQRFSAQGYQHYGHEEYGFKYNMPDIAASLGLHQLKRVNENYQLRQKLWNRYLTGLRALPIGLPGPVVNNETETHALHLFQIRIEPKLRDKILAAYAAEGIGVGVHYLALTTSDLYKPFIKSGQSFENAESFGAQTISLPLGTAMSEADVDDVVAATKKILRFYVESR